LLTEGDELDIEVAEEFEGLDEVPHRAAKAIEGCNYHHIYSPSPDSRHQVIESLPPIGCTGDPLIDIVGHLFPSSCTAVLPEIPDLVVAGLVGRADPSVDRYSLHSVLFASDVPGLASRNEAENGPPLRLQLIRLLLKLRAKVS